MNFVVVGTGMYVSGCGPDGYGTILPAIIEWKRKGGILGKVCLVGTNKQRAQDADLKRTDSGNVPREFKEKPLIGSHGLGCVTHPEFIRSGDILGPKTGLYEVNYPLAGFEVRDQDTTRLASLLVGSFFQS